MNQKQLNDFIILYKKRNISQAADELFLTRQALSLSLRSLEEELGVTLFTRTRRGLEPTAAGETVFRYAIQIEQLWQQAMEELLGIQSRERLRIAIHVMYYPMPVLRQIKELCENLTGLRPEVVNLSNSSEGDNLLESGRVDIVITHKPSASPKLHCKKYADNKTVLLMQKDDPLAAKEKIDFTKDLTKRELIFVSEETFKEVVGLLRVQEAVGSMIAADRALLEESIEVDHSLMVIPQNSLITFMTDKMTFRPITNFPVINGLYIVYAKSSPYIHSAVQGLASILRAYHEF